MMNEDEIRSQSIIQEKSNINVSNHKITAKDAVVSQQLLWK